MKRLAALLLICAVLLGAGSLSTNAAVPRLAPSERDQAASAPAPGAPEVKQAARMDVSPPLRLISAAPPQYNPNYPVDRMPRIQHPTSAPGVDTVVQRTFGPLVMPTPIQNFDGIYNMWGAYPPDTNGEVGRSHYIQQVNLGFEIWDKTGTSVYGPASFNTLFTGFGGNCERRNDGDPVVLYDQLADRWLLTQFTSAGPYFQCIAISTSGDPTGSYYRYAFPESTFEDYPHLGVWPDAYYMATNGNGGAGGAYAFERDRMLTGDPNAREVVFHGLDAGLLPSDLDGFTLPPAGSPNYFLEWYDNNPGSLHEFKFHVDWANPGSSTFTGPVSIPVANFDPSVPDIEQPGTTVRLDSLSDRLMFRVPYRNLGDHEVLLANHTVRDATTTKAAVRWYELRDPGGTTPVVYQQGTYAPDATNRWMGSIAMDWAGDIAAGYSAASTSVYPSIRYAGRLVADPLGEFSQGEGTIIDGTGSQTGTASRWGDYSDITVDPVDDCTFWYTTEYIQVTGERTWRTRIGSFRFPSCANVPPTPTATGTRPVPTATHTVTNTPTPTTTLCPSGATYTDSITNSDPTQTGREAQFPPPSTCAQPKSCVQSGDSILRHYKTYSYVNNTGAAQCVSVNLTQNCGNNSVWSVAYLNTFNPTSLCLNYIADSGRGGPSTTYSFSLPAGNTAVIVVHEVSADLGCATYTLTINPCANPAGPTFTPTNTASPTQTSITSTPTQTGTPIETATETPTAGSPTVTSTPCTLTFTDVNPPDYFYEAVMYLACHGVISGYSDGTFRPYNDTTRGQLSKIVVLAEGWPIATPTGTPTFQDVPASNPFYAYIETAYSRAIISGYSCGTGCLEFRPFNNITRGQLTKVIVLAQNWAITPPSTPTFVDVPLNHPFYGYIETAYAHQIISGYSCGTGCLEFRPYNNATRGQIAKIVYNAITGP